MVWKNGQTDKHTTPLKRTNATAIGVIMTMDTNCQHYNKYNNNNNNNNNTHIFIPP